METGENEMFRELLPTDYGAIADNYNKNLTRDDKVWCGNDTNFVMTAMKVRLHSLSLKLRGKPVTHVHERDSKFVAYFGGYEKNGIVTYTIGVIDLDIPDFKKVWKQDAAYFLKQGIDRGVAEFRISLSNPACWVTEWAEKEVGMKRYKDRSLWIVSSDVAAKYVEGHLNK